MSCVKLYGKFNNTDSTQVHTAPFMVHISSTPVVKYLIVIRAYLFKWWGNIKYHRFSAETGQWLSTDVCQLGSVHRSVWLCESLIGQMKQEPENGEVVSSWGWLKFPTTSAHIRRESGWINEMENLEKGSREWRPMVGNLTRVDFLMLNQTFWYSMSKLINTVEAVDTSKKTESEKYLHVSVFKHRSLQRKHALKIICFMKFSTSQSPSPATACNPPLLGCLRVRLQVTWAKRNERWMTGRSPTHLLYTFHPKQWPLLSPVGVRPLQALAT